MRNIVILVLIIVALAIVRSLISDVSRAVSKAMKPGEGKAEPGKASGKTGRFVRDPHTGSYIDEASAVQATVDGESYFFESANSRDAYLRGRPKA
jgi:hypothetical protein